MRNLPGRSSHSSPDRRSGRCSGPRVPCKGSLFQQVQVLPRQRSSQPGSYPRGRGGNEAVEAWEKGGDGRSSASWQAVTRVNTEAAPKYTTRRPTLPGLGEGWHGQVFSGRRILSASPGWWVTACQQGATSNTGSPLGWLIGSANMRSGRMARSGGGGARSTDEAG